MREIPSDSVILKAAMYDGGMTADKSGFDAINLWAETATQQEKDKLAERAKWVVFGEKSKKSLLRRIIGKITKRNQ